MVRNFETVNVKFDEETGVGTVEMNRPESLNALNKQLRRDIVLGLRSLETVTEDAAGVALRAVILEGAGDRAFCAGADINEFAGRTLLDDSDRSHYAFVREFPAPIIARIDGYCLGGGFETALSCDFRFCSTRSTFGFPEIDLGILPGAGGSQLVEKLAGPGVAKELSMTGKHITADRAVDDGLVHGVYDASALDKAVQEFAETLASKPPLAIRRIKRSVKIATETGLTEGIDYDREAVKALRTTRDAEEGWKAFVEDRELEFTGQ